MTPTTVEPTATGEAVPDARARLMPYGRVLSIAPQVLVETGSGRTPTETVATIRFGVSWT